MEKLTPRSVFSFVNQFGGNFDVSGSNSLVLGKTAQDEQTRIVYLFKLVKVHLNSPEKAEFPYALLLQGNTQRIVR